jgi:AcrR family transcriptional regulator
VAKLRKVEQKQGFHHGNLRRALIDGALQILAKEGAEAITLREVARRAGVTHAAPYRHFSSKEALLAAVAEEGFRQLAADLEAAARAPERGDSLDRLEAFGDAYIRFAVKHPAHYRLMYGPEFAQRGAHPSLSEVSRGAFALLFEGVRRAQEDKLVRDDDTVQLALTMWSSVHGLALLILDRQLDDAVGRGQTDPVVRTALSTLRDGLSAKKK